MENKDSMPKESKSFLAAVIEGNRYLLSEITPEKISLTRTSAYAGAGASLAALLILVQLKSLTLSLELAVIAFSLAIPLLIFVANINELFLWLGKQSYDSYKEMNKGKVFVVIMVIAYGMFAAGFFALIFYLSVLAFVLSFVASFILLATTSIVTNQICEELENRETKKD